MFNVEKKLARKKFTISEGKKKRFKLKQTLLKQKYSESLLKASKLKAKKILPEVSRQPQTTKNYKIIPFITTNNPNNPNMFPRIK